MSAGKDLLTFGETSVNIHSSTLYLI